MANGYSPERRRHARARVSWPVVVEGTSGAFHLQTVDLGPLGAKVKTTEKFPEGASVTLHFEPPSASPIEVSAVVWRVDPDGIVFFFIGELE